MRYSNEWLFQSQSPVSSAQFLQGELEHHRQLCAPSLKLRTSVDTIEIAWNERRSIRRWSSAGGSPVFGREVVERQC